MKVKLTDSGSICKGGFEEEIGWVKGMVGRGWRGNEDDNKGGF